MNIRRRPLVRPKNFSTHCTTGALLVTLAALLGPAPAFSQLPPGKCQRLERDRSPFLAAGSLGPDRRFPKVALDGSGAGIVVWEAFNASGADSDRQSVQAQRLDPEGKLVGSQFLVNTTTPDEQRYPDVAMSADGRTVVVWQSGAAFGEKEVRARVYSPNGNPLGPDFRVNTTPVNPGGNSSNAFPAVAMAADGAFVVAWASETTTDNDSDAFSVQVQRFAKDATRRGGQIQANTSTQGQQYLPDAAMASDGSFVIAWEDFRPREIAVRRFRADGTPTGNEVHVGGHSALNAPSIAMAPQGHFLVTWADYESGGSDQDGSNIQAQGFDRLGRPIGPTFQVNQIVADDQFEPQVSAGPAGDFLVAWESESSNGSDADGGSIQARHVSAPGRFFDVQFQANEVVFQDQSHPAVAMGPEGATVVYFSIGWQNDLEWETVVERFRGGVSPSSLCLNQRRFLVEVDWRDFQTNQGTGSVVSGGSDDSGLFWFFNQDNWEMLVKVIDGCPLNNRFWVFAAATTDVAYDLKVTDLWTGDQKVYENPLGRAADAITDSGAFATCDLGARPEPRGALVNEEHPDALLGWSTSTARDLAAGQSAAQASATFSSEVSEATSCTARSDALCLGGGRFEATVSWRTAQGTSGKATRVPFGSDDSGLFWFFNQANWEMLVKVIDGCALNGSFWVFSAATTDVEYTLEVRDTVTGRSTSYSNPLGSAAAAITDTNALACN